MRKRRDRLAERLVKQNLDCGVGKMLFRADHVCDLELSVVDDRRKVVQRRPVRTHDVWIKHQRGVPFDVPADLVFDFDLPILRHFETQHPGISIVEFLLNLRAAEFERSSHACRRFSVFTSGFFVSLNFFRRVEAAVRFAFGQQPIGGSGVKVASLRLKIRTVVATDFRAFVPIEIQPTEGLQNWSESVVDVPLLVGIVDSEDKLPSVLFRIKPVEQSGSHPANVHVTSRAGSKTRADSHGKAVSKSRLTVGCRFIANEDAGL